MISLNIEKTFGFISKEKVFAYEAEVKAAQEMLEKGTGKGNDFLGWLHLPSSITKEHLADLNATAKVLRDNCEVVIVAGIGGSYLGARAVIEALSNSFTWLHIVDRFNGTACGWGNNFWLVIALAVNFAIMAFGVGGGIERANKVMMPVLFFLFAGLGVYIATLPGAGDGYRYLFTLDPAGLADPKLWIYAFGQAFFSLSVAGNGTVIYGSYFSDDEPIPSAARNVALFDTLAALLAALVIIPAMAAGGADLSDGGPGLMFIFLVNVFNGMPGGRVIGLVFFLCVLFAGLTSLVNLYEVSVEALQDKLHLKRVAAVAVIAVIGTAVSLCIQAIVSDWMDVVSIYICPLGALLAGILFFWVAGKDFVLAAVNKGAGKPIGAWFYPLSKYVYCACALLALIAGALLGGIG